MNSNDSGIPRTPRRTQSSLSNQSGSNSNISSNNGIPNLTTANASISNINNSPNVNLSSVALNSSTSLSSNNTNNSINNTNNNNNSIDQNLTDSNRKRQSKRDDAIRRKIENDLKKKSNLKLPNNLTQSPKTTSKNSNKRNSLNNNNINNNNGGYLAGSVMSLKPTEPVICKPSNTVYEAAQLMSLTKENCVLVVDDINEELLGIFTAKDLAFRIVGSNLNANQITIDQIMTPNPFCAKTSTMASDALTLMVNKGFRHLPIVNDLNQIIGVLDITKCYNEAMTKLERMYENSKKLHEAMEGVHAEMGGMQNQPNHIVQYLDNLKSLINGPTLDSVLDQSTYPVYVDIKSSVFDAANLMKDNRTTAVLVKDTKNNDEVTGIFTSKDVVLRVIAAGIDPKTCSVIRVMTPKPDFASSELTIHQALRKMFDGRYLNLPVIDPLTQEIIGIVEVLKLTHCTLTQLKSMQSFNQSGSNGNNTTSNGKTHEGGSRPNSSVSFSNTGNNNQIPNETEGPIWNKFWTSFDNDTESLHSITSSPNDVTQSEFAQFSINNGINNNDLVKPSDSISHNGIDRSSVGKLEPVIEIDFDESFFFKFKSPAGRSHRISCKPSDGIESLRSLIDSKLTKQDRLIIQKSKRSSSAESSYSQDNITETESLATLKPSNSHVTIGTSTGGNTVTDETEEIAISYIDDEGDLVAITIDQDLKDCVYFAKQLLKDKVDLYIHHPDQTPDIDIPASLRYSSSKTNTSIHNRRNLSANNSSTTNSGTSNNELIKELLLPGALFTLAAAIVIGFSLSRK
ncbi:hypothetical protein B5S32_g2439 [[Candida] boidinii]|nr:hypothetical protein B5S32_g2439 [[Candida] boidinii]